MYVCFDFGFTAISDWLSSLIAKVIGFVLFYDTQLKTALIIVFTVLFWH